MKKVLSVFLVLACLMMGMNAFAADLDQGAIPQTVTGYLYDDEGNCVEVVGHLVEKNSASLFSANDNLSATYEFNLLASSFNSNPVSSPDSGYVSTVYLTVSYYVNSGSYLLSSVSGSWTISDYSASVTSASVYYACVDSRTSSQTGSRSVSNNFYVGTGFSTYVSGFGLSVGASLTLRYQIGASRSWSFTLPNYVA